MFPLLFFKDDDEKKEGKKEAKEKKQAPPAPTESSKDWSQSKVLGLYTGTDGRGWCVCVWVCACEEKHDQTPGCLITEGAL